MTTIPELETPVSAPEISGASLTSHLDPRFFINHSAEADEAAEAMEKELSSELQGLKLPATLAESLALVAKIRETIPEDRRFVAIKAARLKKMAAHIHALSQSPLPPKIDHFRFRLSVSAPRPEALEYFTGAANKAKGKRV